MYICIYQTLMRHDVSWFTFRVLRPHGLARGGHFSTFCTYATARRWAEMQPLGGRQQLSMFANLRIRGMQNQSSSRFHPECKTECKNDTEEYQRLEIFIGQESQFEHENGADPGTNLKAHDALAVVPPGLVARCTLRHEGSVRSHRKMGSCPVRPLLESLEV